MENEFGNGLMKQTENVIFFVRRQIDKIKMSKQEFNTPRQISNGGKLLAYRKVLEKMLARKRSLENKLK